MEEETKRNPISNYFDDKENNNKRDWLDSFASLIGEEDQGCYPGSGVDDTPEAKKLNDKEFIKHILSSNNKNTAKENPQVEGKPTLGGCKEGLVVRTVGRRRRGGGDGGVDDKLCRVRGARVVEGRRAFHAQRHLAADNLDVCVSIEG